MSTLAIGTFTLRLPGPPLPPKPLHLTTQRTAARIYPQMPSWSRPPSLIVQNIVNKSEDEEEEDADDWWGAKREIEIGATKPLYSQPNTRITPNHPPSDSVDDIVFEEMTAGGRSSRNHSSQSDEGTLKTTRAPVKAAPARRSIFFDPSRPNPLVDRSLQETQPHSRSIKIEASENDQLEVPDSLPAVTLYVFVGETAFGELSFDGGIDLRIEVEDLGGGWSLGYPSAAGEQGRGLIPRGFYAYVEQNNAPATQLYLDPSIRAPSIASQPLSIPSLISPDLHVPPSSPISASASSAINTTPALLVEPLVERPRGRSIAAAVIISGVEIEPVPASPVLSESQRDFSGHLVPVYVEEPPIEVLPASKVEIEDVYNGFEAVNDYQIDSNTVHARSTSIVTCEIVESEQVATDDSQPTKPTKHSAPVEAVIGGTVDILGLSNAFDNDAVDPAAHFETSSADPAAVLSPSPLASHSLLSTSRVDVAPRLLSAPSRSLSLPGLYRLGLGTLGRTYALTGIGSRTGSTSVQTSSTSKIGRGGVLKLVQEWIQRGETIAADEHDATYHIETGPAWKKSDSSFVVLVHSPQSQQSPGFGSHTVYQISTFFDLADPHGAEESLTISVDRRYSHFSLLHSLLVARYPLLSIFRLPSNSYAGRMNREFIESRRRDLQRWLSRLARHPVLSQAEELRGFLGTQSDSDLKLLLPTTKSILPLSDHFFAQVYHPGYNIDIADAIEIGQRFERHVQTSENGNGMRDVELSLAKIRQNRADMAMNERGFAHSLFRVIGGLALPNSAIDPSSSRVQNTDGAWTWKVHCDESLAVSKAVQTTAEAIDDVAKLQDDGARRSALDMQELLRDMSFPHSQHAGLIEAHKLIVEQHRQALPIDDEEAISRCETLLNLTTAEMELVHEQQLQDLRQFSENYLDAQITMHTEALEKLQFARGHFHDATLVDLAQTGARLASHLAVPPPMQTELTHPSPYGLPKSTVFALATPVNDATQILTEGVGSILGRQGEGDRSVTGFTLATFGGSFGTRRLW